MWDNVFMNGPNKICGRQPLKHLKWYGLFKQTISLQIFQRLSSTNFTWFILEYIIAITNYKTFNTPLLRKTAEREMRSLQSFHS